MEEKYLDVSLDISGEDEDNINAVSYTLQKIPEMNRLSASKEAIC